MEENKRPKDMKRIDNPELAESFIAEQVKKVKVHCREAWTHRWWRHYLSKPSGKTSCVSM